jgi:predicted nucleic acid-binding Zn ribbon protein
MNVENKQIRKTINNTCHSEEWILSKELAKRNRTLKIILVVVVALWLVTIAGWLYYPIT